MNGETRLSPDTKIRVPVGCVDYLYDEVKRNKEEIRFLRAENNVMHNFFSLVNRIDGVPRTGMGCTDSMWEAKRDIEAGKAESIRNMPTPMPPPSPEAFNMLVKSNCGNEVGPNSQVPEKEISSLAASTT